VFIYAPLLQDKESWDLKSNADKIEAAAKKKDEGNAWFKMGKYAKASKRYEKVNGDMFLTQNLCYSCLIT
jgi:FK506-binding protein 4/5